MQRRPNILFLSGTSFLLSPQASKRVPCAFGTRFIRESFLCVKIETHWNWSGAREPHDLIIIINYFTYCSVPSFKIIFEEFYSRGLEEFYSRESDPPHKTIDYSCEIITQPSRVFVFEPQKSVFGNDFAVYQFEKALRRAGP